MSTMRWLIRMAMLVAVCAALALPPPVAAAEGGIVPGSVVAKALGTFNGVAYTQYNGEFVGTTAGDYAVGFEIVAPTDPTRGNGITVVETMHVMGATVGRDAYFTPAFFYNRGFTYAGIWWHPAEVDPFAGYSAEEANQILHNFGLALGVPTQRTEDGGAGEVPLRIRRVQGHRAAPYAGRITGSNAV